jgi:hypothetical protein
MYALTVAEYFRDAGKDVVLFMDSITRFCQAQRQIGLAVGEPPATKGYTPSVFALLPTLMERMRPHAVRLDHGVLHDPRRGRRPDRADQRCRARHPGRPRRAQSRDLANAAHWPAIDVLQSVSRLANDVSMPSTVEAREQVIRLLAAYRDVEDLVNIGAYATGSNPQFDLAMPSSRWLTPSVSRRRRHSFRQGQQLLQRLQIASQAKLSTRSEAVLISAGFIGATEFRIQTRSGAQASSDDRRAMSARSGATLAPSDAVADRRPAGTIASDKRCNRCAGRAGHVGRIRQHGVHSNHIAVRVQKVAIELLKLRGEIEQAREKLLTATKARKAVELLRHKRYERWMTEQRRAETRDADELATQAYARQMAHKADELGVVA